MDKKDLMQNLDDIFTNFFHGEVSTFVIQWAGREDEEFKKLSRDSAEFSSVMEALLNERTLRSAYEDYAIMRDEYCAAKQQVYWLQGIQTALEGGKDEGAPTKEAVESAVVALQRETYISFKEALLLRLNHEQAETLATYEQAVQAQCNALFPYYYHCGYLWGKMLLAHGSTAMKKPVVDA